MSIRVERHPDQDVTVFVVEGESSLAEQIGVLRDFYEHQPAHDVIWDFTALAGERLSADDLQEIIAFVANYRTERLHGRTALVSAQDLDYGLSRMSETLAELKNLPWEIRAFRGREAAVAWLADEARRVPDA